MKIKWKTLITAVSLPLLVGGLSALIANNSMANFEMLKKPPFAPPGWLFPVVWTILFVLMGISSYIIFTSDAPLAERKQSLQFYAIQLFFNFFWSIIFFNLKAYNFAFIWLIALLILIFSTAISFYRISKPAAYLLIPYFLWVLFAGYLNLGIALLN